METRDENNAAPTSADDAITVHRLDGQDDLPAGLDMDSLVSFFHHKMKPYNDTEEDVRRGLEYALSGAPGEGGFIIAAVKAGELVGGLAMLRTGMGGYVPENLLLFVAVDPSMRGQGLGGLIIKHALTACEGAIKLHVEPDNPARRLYERLGFTTKYVEMRHEGRS